MKHVVITDNPSEGYAHKVISSPGMEIANFAFTGYH